MKNFFARSRLLILVALILISAFILPFKTWAQDFNSVVWKTNYAKLAASNFYIRIGDKFYYGADDIRISSDPGTTRTTLELTWNENSRAMRLNFYFKMISDSMWELYDLRTYDGSVAGNWIYYSPKDSLGNNVSSTPWHQNYAAERKFLPKASNIDAEIICQECSFNAFINSSQYTGEEYSLEVMNGLPANETISVSTNPMTGYGVNVLLRGINGQVIIDQKNITYKWQPRNTNLVEVKPQNIEYAEGGCAYGILPPCPNMNGQIRGLSPGVTTVDVSVLQDDQVIASNQFDVKITEYISVVNSPQPTSMSEPTYVPRPLSSPASSPETQNYEQLKKEMEVLKGTVGEIELDVKQQRQEINFLKRIIQSIQDLFTKLGWFDK